MSINSFQVFKRGSNSWAFDYSDPYGGTFEVALVRGKRKARKLLELLSGEDFAGAGWEDVAWRIVAIRAENGLRFSDPHPRKG